MQLLWYYPFFFFVLYVSTVTIQKKSRLVRLDTLFSNVTRITRSFLERFHLQ